MEKETWRDRVTAIALVRTARNQTNVRVGGCITVAPAVLDDRYLYIQDGTGGIKSALSARHSSFLPLRLGDCISLLGRVRVVFSEREVAVDDLTNLIMQGAGDAVTPMRAATGAINASVEGQLVKLAGESSACRGMKLFWMMEAVKCGSRLTRRPASVCRHCARGKRFK